MRNSFNEFSRLLAAALLALSSALILNHFPASASPLPVDEASRGSHIKGMREAIARVEKAHPDWKVQDLVEALNAYESGKLKTNRLTKLASKTPLLNVDLLEAAMELEPCYSGNDMTPVVRLVDGSHRALELALAGRCNDTPSEIVVVPGALNAERTALANLINESYRLGINLDDPDFYYIEHLARAGASEARLRPRLDKLKENLKTLSEIRRGRSQLQHYQCGKKLKKQLTRMRSSLRQISREFGRGDTESADKGYSKLVKLAESTGDSEVTSAVLQCYRVFLLAMRCRADERWSFGRYQQVNSELSCVMSDQAFAKALQQAQNFTAPSSIKRLRSIQLNCIEARRKGYLETTKKLLQKLEQEAIKSDDRSFGLQYAAMNVHHAFLESFVSSDLSNPENQQLRSKIFTAWLRAEHGKQPILAASNLKAGGDWFKLETVLQILQRESVYTDRSLSLCHRWGLGSCNQIEDVPGAQKARLGIVSYDDGPSYNGELWLTCRPPTTSCEKCDHKHSSEDPLAARQLISLVMNRLHEVGLQAHHTDANPNVVYIEGNWTNNLKANQ